MKYLILSVIFFAIKFDLISQNTDFIYIYKDTLCDLNAKYYSMLKTSDNNFVIAGQKCQYLTIINTDISGKIGSKNEIYSEINFAGISNILSYKTDSFVIASEWDDMIYKITTSGELIWEKRTFFKDIYLNKNDSLMLIRNDTLLVTIDNKGETSYIINLPLIGSTKINNVKQLKDSSYLIGGYYNYIGEDGLGRFNSYLIKMNKNYDTIWTKGYNFARYSIIDQIEVINNEIYLGGNIQYNSFSLKSLFLAKMNENGDMLWLKNYTDHCCSVKKLFNFNNECLVLITSSYKLLIVNLSGEIVLEKDFNPIDTQFSTYIFDLAEQDNTLVVFGYDHYNIQDEKSVCSLFFYIVSDISEILGTDQKYNAEISIYPNPCKDYLFINYKTGFKIDYIKIYNLNGENIFTKIGSTNNSIIDFRKYPTGIYFYKIKTSIGFTSGKFIKQ